MDATEKILQPHVSKLENRPPQQIRPTKLTKQLALDNFV